MVELFRLEWLDKRNNSWKADETPTFVAGYQVEGRVVLRLSKLFDLRSIIVHVNGEAKVQWTITEARAQLFPIKGIFPTQVLFRSEVIYLGKTITLWAASANQQVLSAGEHQFNFNFLIPPHCPPTFEGYYGQISFCCTVKICRSIMKFDKKICSAFVVLPLAMSSPNLLANKAWPIEQPLLLEQGFIKKTTILLGKAILEKDVFAPGEQIALRFELNWDDEDVRNAMMKKRDMCANAANNKVKLKLVESAEFMGERGVQIVRWDLTDRQANAVPVIGKRKHSIKVISEHAFPMMPLIDAFGKCPMLEGLNVPRHCVSSFHRCPNIDIRHKIEIEFEFDGNWRRTRMSTVEKVCEIPVVIGYGHNNNNNNGIVANGSTGKGCEKTQILSPPPPYHA